jgi:hypothetical protein
LSEVRRGGGAINLVNFRLSARYRLILVYDIVSTHISYGDLWQVFWTARDDIAGRVSTNDSEKPPPPIE